MIIDVWSDVVCPWCFIGKRRLEKALAGFEHRADVQIRHRAFQLDPSAKETLKSSEMLASKYRVSAEQVTQMQANVCAVADGEGLCYNLDDTMSGNTFDAHRLLLWSATIGKEQELLEAMYSAYFEKSQGLFTFADLVAIAESVGIDSPKSNEILASDSFHNEVLADRDLAQQLGATGVPFFVVDMKYGISGAQPLEAFQETLNKAWAESR